MFMQPYPMQSMYSYGAMNSPYYYLTRISPLVEYGLKEGEYASQKHAMTEVALIAYLMGMGYNMQSARRIVESWEIDEEFPYRDM